ncbi:hypothetical protein TNCV_3349671 [Trichonephila clavipes]|nr:hypothetical protein TNCV_3349671 [Trichonephila clavipes]
MGAVQCSGNDITASTVLPERGAFSASNCPKRNFANQFWHRRNANTSSPYTWTNFVLALTAFLTFPYLKVRQSNATA